MTQPTPSPTGPPSTRIPLPGVAGGLFIVAPLLLLIGVVTVLGTSRREFFEGAPTQATFGTVIFLVGVGFALTGIALAGVRTMLQQQVDVLLQADRLRQSRPAGG